MADNGLTNILGQASITNNPKFLSPQGANLGGALFGLGGGKGGSSPSANQDPNRSTLAEHSPMTLPDPEKDIGKIIGGALMKSPISAHQPQLEGNRDLSVDTSNLGHFGEVNSNAGTNATGAPAQSNKQSFWNTTGGGIASSLLGILALGGLGAGIGAISGGRRGAANGASYGMGLGTLQDLALRKEGMEAPYNQQQAAIKAAELANAQKGTLQKDIEFMKANPEDKSLIEDYKKMQNPYGEANIALRAAGQEIQKQNLDLNQQKFRDDQARKLTEATKGSTSILNLKDEIKNVVGFDPTDVDYITDKSGKKNIGLKSTGTKMPDVPGMNVWGIGRVSNYPFAPAEAKLLDAGLGKVLQFTVYDQSGKAISIPEMETFKRNYLNNKYSTKEEMMYGLSSALKAAEKVAKQLESGYSDKTLETVQSRGGKIVSIDRVGGAPTGNTAPLTIRAPKNLTKEQALELLQQGGHI